MPIDNKSTQFIKNYFLLKSFSGRNLSWIGGSDSETTNHDVDEGNKKNNYDNNIV